MNYDRRERKYTGRNHTFGYRTQRSAPAIPKQNGHGLILLMAQMVLCVLALAVVFTIQYINPQEYNELGQFYTRIIKMENEESNEVVRLLATPITTGQLRQWWEDWQPPKLAEVFAWMKGKADMGGEETVFPRNASYRKLVVSIPAMSPFETDAAITSEYGERTHPISNAWDFHTGIDLAAAAGTDIYPVYAGEVTAAGSSQSYGNYVKLRHCDNLETVYCHCEKILCQKGDWVTVNDVIARVGSTGVSTGPHLHLSVLADGYYVNPFYLYS